MEEEVAVASEALVTLGADPIDTFTGDADVQVAADSAYSTVIGYCLSVHPWRFLAASRQLARDVAVPDAPYEASYALPSGTLRVLNVRVNDYPIEFDRFENKILCNAVANDLVIADVTLAVQPSYWPGYFRAFVVQQLAAALAIPVTGDTELFTATTRAAAQALTAAKTADSQGRTPRRFGLGRLSAQVAGAKGW